MTKSKIFLYFCLSFILGIFIDSLIFVPQFLMLGILIFGLILISAFWAKKRIIVVGFCILFLVLGIWRHQVAEIQISKSKLQIYNDKEEIITLVGVVAAEPDFKANSAKLKIKIEELKFQGNLVDVSENILVTTSRYPEYKYGDKLEITGKLKIPPEDIGGFNYKSYLKKDGIYFVMDWPKIELINSGSGNPLMENLFSFKNKFKSLAQRFISPPQEGILEALIFGDEDNISKEWKDKLNLTGTRHITAVSGMNITIIANILMGFLLSVGLWRQQAFYFTVITLILYILMIGAPASAVRAGIMAGVLLLAQNLGRLNSASRAVVFASVFMLLQNPLLLRFDVGFQLSFLAIMGMIYLGPYFHQKFQMIPEFLGLRLALTSTISAQIFTLPILIYNFGRISLVSPIANILIVPFLAPITILIFIFGLLGIISLPLGYIFSWLIWLCLGYIVKIIDWLSFLSFSAITIKNVHWLWLVILYMALGYLAYKLNSKSNK